MENNNSLDFGKDGEQFMLTKFIAIRTICKRINNPDILIEIEKFLNILESKIFGIFALSVMDETTEINLDEAINSIFGNVKTMMEGTKIIYKTYRENKSKN